MLFLNKEPYREVLLEQLKKENLGKLIKRSKYDWEFSNKGTHKIVDVALSFSDIEYWYDGGGGSYPSYYIDFKLETLKGRTSDTINVRFI
jgi:hypothetical protein